MRRHRQDIRSVCIVVLLFTFAGCAGPSLHTVSAEGKIDAVQKLLAKGTDVNTPNEKHWYPLHLAANNGHLAIVELLLKNGADVDRKIKTNQMTALQYAAWKGHVQIADLLLQHGAEIETKDSRGYTPFLTALNTGQEDVARFLLQKGANPKAVSDKNNTALQLASSAGFARIVSQLIDAGFDVNAKNNFEATPLHFAANKGHTEVVELLLQHGAHASPRQKGGFTPLHAAMLTDHRELVTLLLDAGAEVDARSRDGQTPLHIAARHGSTESVTLLIKHGADVTARKVVVDKKGVTSRTQQWTPLHYAAFKNRQNVIRQLIAAGADPDVPNSAGKTPRGMLLAKLPKEEVVALLQVEEEAFAGAAVARPAPGGSFVGVATAPAPGRAAVLPQRGQDVLTDPGRINPWDRLAAFEQQYRGVAWNYWPDRPARGSQALLYPTTTQLQAAWTYVLAGRDFAAVNELGGATRAYWAALALVSQSFGSRPDREEIRRAAFQGLAGIAKERNQKYWGQLLELSAELCGAYLNSTQAITDASRFYHAVGQIAVLEKEVARKKKEYEAARQEVARAKQEAADIHAKARQEVDRKEKATFWKSLGSLAIAGIGAFSGQMSHEKVDQEITRQHMNSQVEFARLKRERKRADQAYGEAQKRLEGLEQDIQEAESELEQKVRGFSRLEEGVRLSVLEDVFQIQEGKSFVGQELNFYLTNAADPMPYVQVLEAFAQDKPTLKQLVGMYRQTPPSDPVHEAGYQELLEEIQKIEIYAALKERRQTTRQTKRKPFFLPPREEAFLGTAQ